MFSLNCCELRFSASFAASAFSAPVRCSGTPASLAQRRSTLRSSSSIRCGLREAIAPKLSAACISGSTSGLAAYPSATVVDVRLTKNVQNYMDSSLNFTYYAQPSVRMYDPPGGKFEGNTSTRLAKSRPDGPSGRQQNHAVVKGAVVRAAAASLAHAGGRYA